ncbi:MAG: arylamine N-acetyltransferase family protein [Candidatus Kariarchaeaceae archaeon]
MYLRRLRLSLEEPSLGYLNRLQNNHYLYIPFENLDVMNKKHIQLSYSGLFEKIINNNRGGFCFELNGLFADLLYSLGFSVYMAEAAVYNQELQSFGYMRNHMTLIVTIDDNPYLTDVGFGDSFRNPISLKTKNTEDITGKYRIVEYEAAHYRLGEKEKLIENFDYYILEHTVNDTWEPQYKFHHKCKFQLEDYQANCNWVESSPDSHFTQGRTWTVAKKDGRVSLSENGVTITQDLNKTKTDYNEKLGFEQYLQRFLKEIR